MNDGLKEINEPLMDFLATEGTTSEMAVQLENAVKNAIGTPGKAHIALLDIREEGCVPSDNKLISALAKNFRGAAIDALDKQFKPADPSILRALRDYGDSVAFDILRVMLKPPRSKHDVRDTGLPDSRRNRISNGRKFHKIDQCDQPTEAGHEATRQMENERSLIKRYLSNEGEFAAEQDVTADSADK